MKRTESEIALRHELRRLVRWFRSEARKDRRSEKSAPSVHLATFYRGLAEANDLAAKLVEQTLKGAR